MRSCIQPLDLSLRLALFCQSWEPSGRIVVHLQDWLPSDMQTFHYFRPVFTRRLLQRLQKGALINLIGQDKEGATRLIEDIAASELEEVGLVAVDLAACATDLHTLVQAFSEELRLPTPADDFPMIFEILQLHGGIVILLLNHGEVILDTQADPKILAGWSTIFSKLQLAPNLGLLWVSEQPMISFDKWPTQGQMELLKLPPMSYKRLKEELLREIPQLEDWQVVAQPIFGHPQRYQLLQFAIQHLQQKTPVQLADAEACIQEVLAQFAQDHGGPVPVQPPSAQPWWKRIFS